MIHGSVATSRSRCCRAAFTADPDRLRRFEQEARAAAAPESSEHPRGPRHRRRTTARPTSCRSCSRGRRCATLSSGALPVRKAIDYAIADRARARGRARERHRPSRPQAREHVHHRGRPREDSRLRPGQAHARPTAGRGTDATTAATRRPGSAMLGTVGYMAPEQVRAQPVDHRDRTSSLRRGPLRDDLGARAFRGETTADTIAAILKTDPPELTIAADAAVPPALERLVHVASRRRPSCASRPRATSSFNLEALSASPAHRAASSRRRRRSDDRLALSRLLPPPSCSRPWPRRPAGASRPCHG